jgi:secreted trypsin-like serine protease
MSVDFDFFPYRLQEVQLPIVSNQECKEVNAQTQASKRQVITENKMCAGYITGSKDSCQGDSGGPMLIKKNDQYYLAGIVSSGNGCALPLAYGLYTRVANFVGFIDKQIHFDYLAKADINQDGIVDINDKEAKYAEMQSATRDYIEQCWLTADLACGDVNRDKKIDWRDLSKKTARLESAYNVWLKTMWRPEQ